MTPRRDGRKVTLRLLAKQGNRCVYCRNEFGDFVAGQCLRPTLDHFAPYSMVKKHTDTFAACQFCNAFKHDKWFGTMAEARLFLRKKWLRRKMPFKDVGLPPLPKKEPPKHIPRIIRTPEEMARHQWLSQTIQRWNYQLRKEAPKSAVNAPYRTMNQNTMQTIPDTYKQAGHAMQLVKREGMVAMYKAAGAGYWEIHVIKEEKSRQIFGKEYPEREALASSSEFGQRGWACISQERADGRFADALVLQGANIDAEAV